MTQDTLKIGDKIKDNDPRSSHRILVITSILPNGVEAELGGRRVSILRRRIYTDGKPRRSGFSLLASNADRGIPNATEGLAGTTADAKK